MKKIIFVLLIMWFTLTVPLLSQSVEYVEETPAVTDGHMGVGVLVNQDTSCIQLIDPHTMSISEPYFKGLLGSYGQLLDVVITADGKIAILSNFMDQRIYFVDISGGFGVEPVLLGSQYVHMMPEDIAITPDDRYVMITNGGTGRTVSVLEIRSMRFVLIRKLSGAPAPSDTDPNALDNDRRGSSIAIHPDGQTVLVADYAGSHVHVLLWDSEIEDLRWQTTHHFTPFHPLNLIISPDGNSIVLPINGHSRVITFAYVSPGILAYKGNTPLPAGNSQSAVFSQDSSKLYYQTSRTGYGTQILIMDVTGPGMLSYSGTSIPVTPGRGPFAWYGIETLAMDTSGTYLFMTNPSEILGVKLVSAIDLTSNSHVANLPTNGICAGIAFTNAATSEEESPENQE